MSNSTGWGIEARLKTAAAMLALAIGVSLGGVRVACADQLFADDFNRADGAVANDWALGGLGNSSISNGTLVIRTGGASGRDWIWRDTSGWGPGYSPNFSDAAGTLVWNYKFTSSRSSLGGFDSGSYGMALVLGASSNQFSAAGVSGYAVLVGNNGAPDPLRLQYFNNGLSSEAALPVTGPNVLASWSTSPTKFNGNEQFSVQVQYVPGADTWSLYASSKDWTVPLSTADLRGSAVHTPPGALPNFGIFFNHSSGDNYSQWEDVQAAVLVPEPTLPSSNLVFRNVFGTQMTIHWDAGSGDQHLVVAAAYTNVTAFPLDGIGYVADPQWGVGSQLGVSNYVVYLGTGTEVTVTGLQLDSGYAFGVFDVATGPGTNFSAANYSLAAAPGNPAWQMTSGTGPDQDSRVDAPNTFIMGGALSALSTNPAAPLPVFEFDIVDRGTADGLATRVTQITIQPGDANTANWASTIQSVNLFDVTDGVPVPIGTPSISASAITIPVTLGSLDVFDGGDIEVQLQIVLKAQALQDHAVLAFKIPATGHGFAADVSGSQFDATFVNGDVSSDAWTLDVVGTSLRFLAVPDRVLAGRPFGASIAVVDALGSVDLDATGMVSLVADGDLWGLREPGPSVLSGGSKSWAALQFPHPGSYLLNAQVPGLFDASANVQVINRLEPGDIAIVGVIDNAASGPDTFALAALRTLPAGTTLYFTDNGWVSTGGYRGASASDGSGNEGVTRFTALRDIAPGTIMQAYEDTDAYAWATNGAIPGVTAGNWSDLQLGQSGDQIGAFMSAATNNPLFHTEVSANLCLFDYTAGFESASNSATGSVPSPLKAGQTALTFPVANVWSLNLDGQARSKPAWLAYIADVNNWTSGTNGVLPSGQLAVQPVSGLTLIIR